VKIPQDINVYNIADIESAIRMPLIKKHTWESLFLQQDTTWPKFISLVKIIYKRVNMINAEKYELKKVVKIYIYVAT